MTAPQEFAVLLGVGVREKRKWAFPTADVVQANSSLWGWILPSTSSQTRHLMFLVKAYAEISTSPPNTLVVWRSQSLERKDLLRFSHASLEPPSQWAWWAFVYACDDTNLLRKTWTLAISKLLSEGS